MIRRSRTRSLTHHVSEVIPTANARTDTFPSHRCMVFVVVAALAGDEARRVQAHELRRRQPAHSREREQHGDVSNCLFLTEFHVSSTKSFTTSG